MRENIVTMRLIFPMDVIYGLMYSLYLIGATIIRSMYQKISPIDYTYYYDLLNSVSLPSLIDFCEMSANDDCCEKKIFGD